jgi:predicted P-loop ATPase
MTARPPAWTNKLIVGAANRPVPNLANALTALREAPEWEGVLRYDDFGLRTIALRPPPWAKKKDNSWQPTLWTDHEDSLTAEWLQRQGINVPTRVVSEAVETVAKENSFHPIRDYLNGLEWDHKERVEDFAATYLGATSKTRYHRAVCRCWFVSAIARVMEPGVKADHVPILEGPQGAGKSSVVEELSKPWFSDDIADLGTKDSAMQVRSTWVMELSELSAMTKSAMEKIKAFISRKHDRYRPPYGRRVVEVPRQNIFIGSTNDASWNKDLTGARRFFPIACGEIDLEAVKRDRDQLWAEAFAMYKTGLQWWLTDEETALAVKEQEARLEIDEWREPIGQYVADREQITVGAILHGVFGLDGAKWDQRSQNRVANCLKSMGWARCQRRVEGRKTWVYVKPNR